jgi:hypothetical protein
VPALVRHPQRGPPGVLGHRDRAHQDVGQHRVISRRDAHLHVDVGGRVHLRRAPGAPQPGRPGEAGLEQPRVDQLVQVKGRQLAGDPDRGRRLVPGDRAVGAADELVHPPAQVIGQHGHGGQGLGIGTHTLHINAYSHRLKI